MKKLYYVLVVLLFCSTSAFATDNPLLIGYPNNKIMGFRGLDTSTSAPMIEDGRSPDMLNVTISSGFDLMKRYGYSVVNDTLDDLSQDPASITGIFDAEWSDTTSYTLAFVGAKLKYDAAGTWTDVDGTATITTGANYQWACTMALDYAICTNNQNPPIKVSSTPEKSAVDFSDLAAPVTKAKAVAWYRNYLILGNTYEGASKPTRFRFSNVGTLETYSETDYDDLASLNGDEIVSFVEMYGDLYIIMRKSIWKASLVGGDDIFVYTKIINGIGAIAKGSVQLVTFPGNKLGIIFLSEDKKIYLFNGVAVTNIGDIIQPTLDSLSASRIQYATGVFDGDKYILSVTTSSNSYNDTVYLYDVNINEWFTYDHIKANAFARVKESTSLIKTYFGNYASFVYWFDDTDMKNDVAGFIGIADSVGTVNTSTQTGATILLDTGVDYGLYTGAVLRITSGTDIDDEVTVLTRTSTGIVITSTFAENPDTTSIYSVGDINSYYKTKWFDFADAPRQKAFRGVYFWAKEQSQSQVTIGYAEDFGALLGSETVTLDPLGASLWDSALWDDGVWGSSGDKFYTTKLRGRGRTIQLQFGLSGIDKTFQIYGYHILADALDRE